jgi:hypothetical protein
VAKRTVEQRVDRLEQVVQIIAEDQMSLQKLIAELATETRKGFDRVAKQFEETDKRGRQIDERIDKLVSAMGEFIRQSKSSKQ